MGAPTPFIRSLVRVANAQGRDVLEAIITGQFATVKANGGKQLVGVSAGGKSFNYQVPSGLAVQDLMGLCEEALEIFDALDCDQIANYLKRAPRHTAVAKF